MGCEMLWRMNENRSLPRRCSRFAGVPVMKLSRQTTSWPSARKRSHKCEPMNPPPPVISVRITSPPDQKSEIRSTKSEIRRFGFRASDFGFVLDMAAPHPALLEVALVVFLGPPERAGG